MSRNYGNYLLLSGVLDNVPTTLFSPTQLMNRLLSPKVKIVEANCQTTLGSVEKVGDSVVGKRELETGLAIDEPRLIAIMTEGRTTISIRTVDTCISSGGVCLTCYDTMSGAISANVGDDVTITNADSSPYYHYLADSYSGALLGLRPLPARKLPVRKELLNNLIHDKELQLLVRDVKRGSDTSRNVPGDLLQYLDDVDDKLEKTLLAIFLYSIYTPG